MKGRPLAGPRLFYTLPHIRPRISGGFFFMSGTNRAIVEHTWGLHELETRKFSEGSDSVNLSGGTREQVQKLSYGPDFVYDEFVITSNSLLAMVWGLGFAVSAFCLFYVPPVSWFANDTHRKRFALTSDVFPHRSGGW